MAEDWYLIQFKPNAHNLANRNLTRQGFVTFLPLQDITRRQGAQFVSQLRPLFPGYMFTRLDPGASLWRKVNSTYGVTRIVTFRDIPTPVPERLVTELLSRCDDRGRLLVSAALATGDRVKVVDGPFSAFVGTIETVDSEKRVWLLLEFMGQSTRIQVNASQVVSLNRPGFAGGSNS